MNGKKKLTVALLSGGVSSERDVSLKGGNQIFQSLDREKYHVIRYDPKTDLKRLVADAHHIDIAFINLHGVFGEDGTIQGFLDLLGIPYQGSGVAGSAIAMNKLISKRLYIQSGLPVPPFNLLERNGGDLSDAFEKEPVPPLVVKPVLGGSSVGVSIVRSMDLFKKAVESAFKHDDTVLIENYIEGIEITVAVIGNAELEALPVIEIIPDKTRTFFDYDAKYTAGITQEICPARIDPELTRKAQAYAKSAHRALLCKGYSRTDMILRDKEIYVLETNTLPGMTQTSLLPLAAKTAGISFSRLLDRLIGLGLESGRSKSPLTRLYA